MKKLFVLFGVLAMSAGVMFAQGNDASIDQTGDEHEAVIEQIGSMNESFVVQTDGSDTNKDNHGVANIHQEGDENYVNLNQRAYFGAGNSIGNIKQIGNNNAVRGVNEGDNFYQNQEGGLLDVYMEGNNNTLRALRGEAQKNNNSFELEILGSDNDVATAQEFGNATVDIEGDANNVRVWQMSGANFDQSLYNTADVDVVGSMNTIGVDQTNCSNNAVVDILGSSNTATVTQSGF